MRHVYLSHSDLTRHELDSTVQSRPADVKPVYTIDYYSGDTVRDASGKAWISGLYWECIQDGKPYEWHIRFNASWSYK